MRLAKPLVWGILASLLLSVAACGSVVFKAPRVTLLVQGSAIVYQGPEDPGRLVGRETILIIRNDDAAPHRIVLARHGATEPQEVPVALREAEFPRDDQRILGMTKVLDAKEATFASGGFGYKIDQDSFHVYLAPGEPYILFDTLGDGLASGLFLRFVAGANG